MWAKTHSWGNHRCWSDTPAGPARCSLHPLREHPVGTLFLSPSKHVEGFKKKCISFKRKQKQSISSWGCKHRAKYAFFIKNESTLKINVSEKLKNIEKALWFLNAIRCQFNCQYQSFRPVLMLSNRLNLHLIIPDTLNWNQKWKSSSQSWSQREGHTEI